MNSHFLIPSTSEEETSTPIKPWSSAELIKYLSPDAEKLLDPTDLPREICLDINEQDFLDQQNYRVQQVLSTGNTYDLFRSTYYYYVPNNLVSVGLSIDTLYYLSENSYQPAGSIFDYQPPEPRFLVPLLDGNKYELGETKGQLFISNNVSILVLRTSETYKLYGNKTAPRYAKDANLPRYFTGNNYSNTIESVENFLRICGMAGLSVYYRPKSPDSKVYSTYFRVGS